MYKVVVCFESDHPSTEYRAEQVTWKGTTQSILELRLPGDLAVYIPMSAITWYTVERA